MKRLAIVATCAVLLALGAQARAETSAETQKTGVDTTFDLSAMTKNQTSGQGGSAVYASARGSGSARAGAALAPASAAADKAQAPAQPPAPAEAKKSDSKKSGALGIAGGFLAGFAICAVIGLVILGKMFSGLPI